MNEKVLITESTLDNIGDAIREKNGEVDKYYPDQMPAAIRRIQTGGGGSGSVVAVFPVLLSGEHIADIVVDGDRFALYAPEPIEYTEGTGITIDANGVVSVSEGLRATISGKAEQTALETAVASLTASLASKQDMLTAGSGISIQNNVISATGGGGASAMEDLTDVSLSNLANGQILKWNSTTQKWENANESGGGSSLPFNVVINSTDSGIDLVYDDGT